MPLDYTKIQGPTPFATPFALPAVERLCKSPRQMGKGKLWTGVIVANVVLAALVLVWLPEREEGEEYADLEALLGKFGAAGRAHADAANCVECHRDIFEEWSGSHHALANAGLTAADRERLRHGGELPEGREMKWRTRARPVPVLEEAGVADYPVVGTIGITPLIQYLLKAPDGRIQTHDVAWDVEKEEWFSVFEGMGEDTLREPGEWGHWTGQGMNWDANCAYCHMTNYRKNFDPHTNKYDLDWDHMGITCSQCHTGMDVHLQQIRNGNNAYEDKFDLQVAMQSCASCHSLRDELSPDPMVAGSRYEDHYQLTLADREGLYHPDGQVIGENYVYGSFLSSRMGHAGLTCMDCHNPHTAQLILPTQNNALCQRCHETGVQDAPVINPLAHGGHPVGSVGNQCIECHMPVTHFMGRDGRRDHSFSNPDPLLTLEMGVPNACSSCHNTESDEWSMRHAEEWYGEDMNADRRAKARLLHGLRNGDPTAPQRLRAAAASEANRFWRGTFLALLGYVEPHPEALKLLAAAAADDDPLIRSTAVRTVGMEALPEALRERLLNDPVRSVRLAAALANPGMQTAGEEQEAELLAYLKHTSDTPMGALRLSEYYRSRGDSESALEMLNLAPRFDSLNPEAHRLAAVQAATLGESSEALRLLEAARELDPKNAMVLYNLGLVAAELLQTERAMHFLRQAVNEDPTMEAGWYNLVVLHWQQGNMAAARAALRDGLTALPESARLRYTGEQLQQAGAR